MLSSVCVHLDVSRLKYTPSIDRIKPLFYQVITKLHLAYFINFFLRKHLFESIGLFTKFWSFSNPPGKGLLILSLLLNLLCLDLNGYFFLFLFNFLLNLFHIMNLLSKLFVLSPSSGLKLGCSFLFVSMSHLNLRWLSNTFDLSWVGDGHFVIDDSIYKCVFVLLSWSIGMATFWDNNSWNLSGFISMFRVILGDPGIIGITQIKLSFDLVVVFLFGRDYRLIFKSIRVQRSTSCIHIIDDLYICLIFLPYFFVILPDLRLEQTRDVDILGPFLFVLFSFESLYFYQLIHFNFILQHIYL